jgi:hypothetical protein
MKRARRSDLQLEATAWVMNGSHLGWGLGVRREQADNGTLEMVAGAPAPSEYPGRWHQILVDVAVVYPCRNEPALHGAVSYLASLLMRSSYYQHQSYPATSMADEH